MLTISLKLHGTELRSASLNDRMNHLLFCISFWELCLHRNYHVWLRILKEKYLSKIKLRFWSIQPPFYKMLVISNHSEIANLFLNVQRKLLLPFGKVQNIGLNMVKNSIKYGLRFKSISFNSKNLMHWFNSLIKMEQQVTTQKIVHQKMLKKLRKFSFKKD